MKLRILGFAAVLLLAAGVYAAMSGHTYAGEITDGTCGNNGSHAMMAQTGDPVEAARKCTMGCVRLGETYVLYDANTKRVYDLSDQKTPEQFAGHKVIVTGTLNKSTMMIKVRSIKAVS